MMFVTSVDYFKCKERDREEREGKGERKRYRVKGIGQPSLSLFLVGKQRPSWKSYPEDFCLFLTAQNYLLWPLLLDGNQGKKNLGWR